jgi:hypothetical protein
MSQRGALGLGDWLADQVTGQVNPTKAIKAYEETPQVSLPLVKDEKSAPLILKSNTHFSLGD